MISQANKEIIATVLNVTVDELSGALSSENEVALDLRLNGTVLTQEQQTTLKESAVQQGKEIGLKAVASELGLQLESGEKDAKIIAEKLKSGISVTLEEKYKNQSPAEELTRAQEALDAANRKYDQLNNTYETASGELGEWKNKYAEKETEIKNKEINSQILKTLGSVKKIDPSDALLIARSNFEFEPTDNGLTIKRNGQTVLNAVGQPESLENAMGAFIEEKKWIKSSGMNGSDRNGNNSGLPKGLSDDDAVKYITEAGHDPMSAKGSEMFLEVTAKE